MTSDEVIEEMEKWLLEMQDEYRDTLNILSDVLSKLRELSLQERGKK